MIERGTPSGQRVGRKPVVHGIVYIVYIVYVVYITWMDMRMN